MNQEKLLYQIALTLVPGIGVVSARNLLSYFSSVEEVFNASKHKLMQVSGIGPKTAQNIVDKLNFDKAAQEIDFIEKNRVQTVFIADENYPAKLKNCYDAPLMLFYRGNDLFKHEKALAIVGTRNATEYGKKFMRTFFERLSNKNILIVSGLAYGVDTYAHQLAIDFNLPTMAVMGTGMASVYPAANKKLAQNILQNGALVSEFVSDMKPNRENFPRRNRIVAGISDAVLVVETGIKGGAVITADLANSYNKDVFALPGRFHDAYSEGCNFLIKTHRANLIDTAEDVLQFMNWDESTKKQRKPWTELALDLSKTEKLIIQLIAESEDMGIDELNAQLNLSSGEMATALLELELKGLILSLPGKHYRIN